MIHILIRAKRVRVAWAAWAAGVTSCCAASPALAQPSQTTDTLNGLLLNAETTAAQVEIDVLRADGASITLTRTMRREAATRYT